MRDQFDVILFDAESQARETLGGSNWFPIPRKDDIIYGHDGSRKPVQRVEYHLDRMRIVIVV